MKGTGELYVPGIIGRALVWAAGGRRGSFAGFAPDLPPRARNASATNGIPGWKRALDVTAITLALPALIPVAAVVAAIVNCSSPGPVLFQQERVGYRGRRFRCYKFRTMFCGARSAAHEEYLRQVMQSDAPMTKMDQGDSRIIPFGKFLRASGLDELPQLINVLKGEMSLVGPRPCLPYEAENYFPWQRERFRAAPGLTGLWQVSGKNRTTFTRMIQLDIEYARRQSLWLDLKIIFKTIPALIGQIRDRKGPRPAPAPAPQPACAQKVA